MVYSPTSNAVKISIVFVRILVQEKIGLKIDQPDHKGGTTSTGGVASRDFSSESKFIGCALSSTRRHFHNYIHSCHLFLE